MTDDRRELRELGLQLTEHALKPLKVVRHRAAYPRWR